MSSYTAGLQEEKKQAKLRARNGITDESVKVIERVHWAVPLLKLAGSGIGLTVRIVFSVLLYVLAATGLTALMLETSREVLIAYFRELCRLFV